MLEHLHGQSRGTVAAHRQRLQTFHKAMQFPGYNSELFKQRVKKIPFVAEGKRGSITPEQMGQFIRSIEDPRLQTIIGFLVNTGCRREEVTTAKVGDVKWDTFPVRVSFIAAKTKTDVERTSFLTTETAQLLKRVLGTRLQNPDQYLFPYRSGDTLRRMIMRALLKAGLTEKAKAGEDDQLEYYTVKVHYFRTFAKHFMVRCGMTENEANWLIGHELKVDASYMDVEEVARKWGEKVEPMMRFLDGEASEGSGPILPAVEKAVERVIPQDDRGVLVKPSTVPQPLTLPMNSYAKSLSEAKEPVSPASSNVGAQKVVGAEIPSSHKEPQEPVYPMKEAPSHIYGGTTPTVKHEEVKQDPNAPIHRGDSWDCPKCGWAMGSENMALDHIRFRHPRREA